MRKLVFAVVIAVAAAPAAWAQPQPAAPMASISGTVIDDEGRPLAGARVSIATIGRTARSASDGAFAVTPVPAGTHELRVTLLGHAPATVRVAVVDGAGTPPVEVTLRRTAVAIAGVQVTASPLDRNPLAVPQATSVVGGRELERTLASTLAATLAAQPGITARFDGPGANAPVVRGLSGDRVLVLQDGHRTGDLASTAPDHGVTIDPGAAQRVEVVRGPAALIYGNNAVGGVVNVISEDVAGEVPDRASSALLLTAESAAPGASFQVERAAPVNTRSVLRVRASARSHGDLRPGGAGGTPLINTAMRNAAATIGLSTAHDAGSSGVAYRGYRFDYGLPVSTGAPADAVTLEGARHELVARTDLRFDGRVERARVDASAQWYDHAELLADGSLGTHLGLATQAAQVVARTRGGGRVNGGAFGASILARQNGVTGPQALTPTNTALSAGAFAYQELSLLRAGWAGDDERVRLPLGVRVDRHAIRSRSSDRFGAGRATAFTAVSASAGLAVPLAPGASLGVSLARAVRAPTAEEMYSRAGHTGTGAYEIGDPDLRTEVSVGTDVVLRVERRRVSGQLAAYDNRIARYIALYPTGRDTTVDDGAGGTKSLPLHVVSQRDARLYGVEGSVEVEAASHLVLGSGGDLVRAADAAGAPLPYMPAARAFGSARWDDGRRSGGLVVRHAFRQAETPVGEVRADGHTLLDVHAGLRLVRATRVHSLTLRVENAGNVLYRDAASRVKHFAPNPGRNVAVAWRVAM